MLQTAQFDGLVFIQNKHLGRCQHVLRHKNHTRFLCNRQYYPWFAFKVICVKWASHLLGFPSVFFSILAVVRLYLLQFFCPSTWILGSTSKLIKTARYRWLSQRYYWKFQSAGMLLTLYHYTRRNIPKDLNSSGRDNSSKSYLSIHIHLITYIVHSPTIALFIKLGKAQYLH